VAAAALLLWGKMPTLAFVETAVAVYLPQLLAAQ
jgi:hypothetical protein